MPINIYFVIDPSNQPATTTTLANSLYGMMSYTKNGSTDPNEDIYSGYGVNFSSKKYAHPDWKDSYDLVIFGVDMSDSKHAENKKNSILVTGKNDLKINNTTIQPEAELKKNCFQGCVLGVHYNDVTDSLSLKGYIYINYLKQYECKTKKSEIVNRPLCLGNIVQYDDETIQDKTSFTSYIHHYS